MTVAQKIRKLRKEKAMTQEQLADKLYTSRQTVSKWERGEYVPDTENLIKICKLFDVSMDYMIDIKAAKKNYKSNKILTLSASILFLSGFIVFAILAASGKITADSSVITLNGYAVISIVCLVLTILSAVILYKNAKNKD